jgi:hypothetical protein
MSYDTSNPAHLFGDRARRERDERDAIAAFVDATMRSDMAAITDLLEPIETAYEGWKRVFRRLARSDWKAKPEARRAWLRFYMNSGDHIRLEVGEDLLLIRALRILLPPYRGRAMTLFRGEGARNRRHRTYGLSWTNRREVAEYHANGYWLHSIGGSVLLRTLAPPDAIICAPHRLDNRYNENEYLVDRRRLDRVTVLQRFSQIPE